MIFTIKIPLRPRAKQAWQRKGNRAYMPSAKGMAALGAYVKENLSGRTTPLYPSGPLLVAMHFGLPLPRDMPKKRKVELDKKPANIRPDGDNLEKFVADALNGIVWADDSQIALLVRSKSFTMESDGYTILAVQPIEASDYLDTIHDLTKVFDEIYKAW